ncbi:MAG TPA: hypothetical protein VIW24_00275 [Aldersonia sp.]
MGQRARPPVQRGYARPWPGGGAEDLLDAQVDLPAGEEVVLVAEPLALA